MTAHDHTSYVEGCFRCELSKDEADNIVSSPIDALCEMCGEAAYYVLTDEALDFCADCAVSLLTEDSRRLREALNSIVLRAVEVPVGTPCFPLARGLGDIAVKAIEGEDA